MIKIIALSVLLMVVVDARSFNGFQAPSAQPLRAARQSASADEQPEPYSFTFETTDEYGMTLTRTESGDAQGNIKGTYMYRDPAGIYRTVEYVDNGGGFSAQVQTNEPGVISHKAADAEYFKQ